MASRLCIRAAPARPSRMTIQGIIFRERMSANAPLGLEFGLYTTSGSDEAVLYDISKPLSIGHLMHANLFNYYGSE